MIPRFPLWWIVFAACLGAASLPAASTTVVMLSGHGPDDAVEWDFFCTAGRNSGVWTKIPVPSCWEQHGFGTYNYGVHHRPSRAQPNPPPLADEQGRYRREFQAFDQWRGQRVRLVFEGVMTDAEVFVNGQSAGPVHQGSFYRFHYDITDLLRLGEKNLLEVMVSKKSANESVNRAERIGDYWIFGGIFRPVWLEIRPPESIDWTGIDARADGSLIAEVHLTAPASRAGVITAQIYAEGGKFGEPLEAKVTPGDSKVTVRGRFPEVKTWTAEAPHLYRVRFTYSPSEVAGQGEAKSAPGRPALSQQHEVTERFGFRTFEVRKNYGLYLNGTKIILKGVNRHCFNPETGRTISREQSYADARLIKEMNMNAVRMAHYPPDKHFLRACDELGLYVLNELAGWQGFYDAPTGARLIGQIVRRDVNHPSIIFWNNGNEGGWNTEVDGEFARWDIQKRPVLHPWALFSDVDTDHYEPWDSHAKKSAGPTIYLPTEMLHGLYDGGIGAGLRDYWDVMMKSPTAAGGFFWVFADEGLVRTDQGGRIDNAGNLAPDGIVGPHGEKEGSFFTVREIWSPVQFGPEPGYHELTEEDPMERSREVVEFEVVNRYHFTNLRECTFRWEHVRYSDEGERGKRTVVAAGTRRGPDVPPGGRGVLDFDLPFSGSSDDRLFLTAVDPEGREVLTTSRSVGLRTWVSLRKPRAFFERMGIDTKNLPPDPVLPTPTMTEDELSVTITAPTLVVRLAKQTGRMESVTAAGRDWPLMGGPALVAMRRDDRRFIDPGLRPRVASVSHGTNSFDGTAWLTVEYEEPKMTFEWRVGHDGSLRVAYRMWAAGTFDILGINFPSALTGQQPAKRWFGLGPYRVWANRREGGVFDVHQVNFNDATPGETYAYPEFHGYFGEWEWLELNFGADRLFVGNEGTTVPFFALGRPRDGVDGLLELPDVGLAFLHVIPAMRNKFHTTDQLGPQSQPQTVSGPVSGSVVFRFQPR